MVVSYLNILRLGGMILLGGRNLTKARYVEYTDATFTTKKPAAAHMGILGPVIRAQVGERIRVVFKNKARFPFSMHPHGVFLSQKCRGSRI